MRVARRSFVVYLAASLAAPLAWPAQARRIAYLGSASRAAASHNLDAFESKMRELGFRTGENLIVEERYAEGNYARLPELAQELVRSGAEVLLTGGTPATRALQQATATIPIVTAVIADPIGDGFTKSLAKPDHNVTGLTNLDATLGGKRLELLTALAPNVRSVAFLVNPDNSNYKSTLADAKSAGARMGINVTPAFANTPEAIRQAFAQMKKDRADAVLLVVDPFINQHGKLIAELALEARLPSVGGVREFAQSGGLSSYGDDLSEYYRRAATLVAKLLQGARPQDLPFEQPLKMAMSVNTTTAQRLGLKVPPAVLTRAEELFE
jgi:putative ABC transport system substrate-binding protein